MRTIRASILQMEFGVGGHGSGSGSGNLLTTSMLQLLLLPFILSMIFKIYSFASRRWDYLFISRQGVALEEEFSYSRILRRNSRVSRNKSIVISQQCEIDAIIHNIQVYGSTTRYVLEGEKSARWITSIESSRSDPQLVDRSTKYLSTISISLDRFEWQGLSRY